MFTFLLNFLAVFTLKAGLVSTMPSTFLQSGIPNSHLVTENVIRGMAPRNMADIDSLLSLGVTDFLIFKVDNSGEVLKEISLLEKKGVTKEFITHLNFPWKDVTDFRPVCEMTIDAIKTIEAAENGRRKIFFHCSLGEDRTGYLAGLYKIYRENKSAGEVFQSELCSKGYEAGNPKKGMNVVMKVRESLTPSFLTMVDLINEAKKRRIPLDKRLCTQKDFNSYASEYLKKFTCNNQR